ncbi:MAG: PAS domain S-box protein [Chloroflexi bacterium]|nr:PAS domain S-box protein [Chloroflexota bacterium]MCH8114066.1 PAS domain S-box protein [Chloroflexota bacterium]MCI0774726.1 PAS domain S-box protein [Chloroflexota bacterium]MCI0803351.1 PAS domain S-box protein [Chloroflexota bacterium]MCI0808594.1 PAS domain S-box protein [Chloroflexota bacterium]
MVSNYRHAVEFLSDAYIVADPVTTLTLDINQVACAALGYERSELLGLLVSDFLPGLERSTVHRMWRDLRYEETISIESTSRRKDGSEFQVLVRVGRTDRDDRPAMQILARDITEDKRVREMVEQLEKKSAGARELQVQNVELTRAHRMISDFLGRLSHEMNTPLTSLISFTDILSKNKPGNLISTQKQQLDVMKRCGAQLKWLISQLLDANRIEAGTLGLNLAQFDIAEAVREAVDSYSPTLVEKNQSLRIHGSDMPHLIEGDKNRLVQVLTNLISNASKYSPVGSHIVISIERVEGNLQIIVKDNGPGISQADQQKIFDAFYRVDNQITRSESGTGLGLSIVKSLIEAHGGKISIESPTGGGAEIGFWLPLVKPLYEAEGQIRSKTHGEASINETGDATDPELS